ncbi:MAG: glutathione-disulfide reductase [Alphaproteobacteria bacterium]|nr:glutathione-disulfide reductase [Alphaproteobacteria bacterium]
MSAYDYDYFVIGAGSGGVRSARIAASHGAKVAVAESAALGGTCVNLGCVPKKLLAYGSDYHAHFEDSKGYGWDVDIKSFDWPTLIANKDKEIERLNGAYRNTLEKAGVEIIPGYARFTDAHTLDIDGRRITAEKILIAVGGQPRKLPVPGGALAVTSDDIFHMPSLPQKIVIVGGGYIAVEFAHILSGLGSEVTLLYRGELFLRGFDDDLRKALAEEMRKQKNIKLCFNSDVDHIEKQENSIIVHGTDSTQHSCDLVLAAIGRDPKTEGLNLGAAGVETGKSGQIIVNERYETSTPHIYALGDVTDTPALTPVAIAEGHVLADRLFGKREERSVNYENIATAVFSAPPLSTVGLTEAQAAEKGYDIAIYQSGFRPMKHTLSGRDERTFMKLVVDRKTDKILGAHMMGLDAPEIMQGFAVALNCGATKADFDRTIAMHPTSAEEFVTMRTERG